MQPWVDSNDGARERLETRQFDSVWLTVLDDRPAHLDPKNGAFATDDNNHVRGQQSFEMSFVEDDDMIQKLSTQATNNALNIGVLPR